MTSHKQIGDAPIVTSEKTHEQYIVELPPQLNGMVVALDHTIMQRLCRDDDGCSFTIQLINWDGTGEVASKSYVLFLSQTSLKWRISNVDNEGIDASGSEQRYTPWDCWITDAEERLDNRNGRRDSGVGLGVLNARNGEYNDERTTCRFVFND